jgi:glycosyltransferase involved in cell wall biosynthesis
VVFVLPLVTVCIPTYNGGRYIRQSVESVLSQTYHNLEIIIVDDQSQDETVRIVEEYACRDSRIRIHLNERNLGLVSNWNHCVALASGTWLKFVFQDDQIQPECIELMLKAADDRSPLVVCARKFEYEEDVSDRVRRMYNEFETVKTLRTKFPGGGLISPQQFGDKFLDHPIENWIGEPTSTLIHQSAFHRFGLFNPSLASLCDWEYWARIGVNSGLYYIDYTGATFRVHEQSESGKYRAHAHYRTLYIDPLIVRYEIAYGLAYAPVRALAAQRRPPMNLIQSLLYEARDARLRAEAYAYDPIVPDHGPLSEWVRAAREYPEFRSVPMNYVLDWVRRRASAIWNWQ